jgi:hypothetical protein
LGYRLDDLWNLTFRQVDLALRAAEDYQKFSPNQETKATEAQAWKDQKSMAMALNAAFGGTFH